MRVLKLGGWLFTGLSLLVSIGCKRPSPNDPTKTGADAIRIIENAFQAKLPASHSEPKVYAVSLMTTAIEGRFEIPKEDFERFLQDSKLLPDTLKAGNPLEGVSFGIGWWEPDHLTNPKGAFCEWKDGDDIVSCQLAIGQLAQLDDPTVFFMIVYESQDQSGASPSIQADPNWHR